MRAERLTLPSARENRGGEQVAPLDIAFSSMPGSARAVIMITGSEPCSSCLATKGGD